MDSVNPSSKSADSIIATLADILRHQSHHELVEILESAEARIEETGFDNWNEGTFYYTLYLDIPIKLFAYIESRLTSIEGSIEAKIKNVLRDTGNQVLSRVIIGPTSSQPATITSKASVPGIEVEHIWESNLFRLFLTHNSSHKGSVGKLKNCLHNYGITAFVAHQDIEPNLEWQEQIELALRSMHALAVLLTPDFKDSKWTDQEVGFALGKGILVIPVRLGLDPYGFIGRVQGLSGDFERCDRLASAMVDVLLKQPSTSRQMIDSMVYALENAQSFREAIDMSLKIESVNGLTPRQKERLVDASKNNDQLINAFGVSARLQELGRQ